MVLLRRASSSLLSRPCLFVGVGVCVWKRLHAVRVVTVGSARRTRNDSSRDSDFEKKEVPPLTKKFLGVETCPAYPNFRISTMQKLMDLRNTSQIRNVH